MSRMLTLAACASDLARVFPNGPEPAKGNQNLDVVAVNGQELADNANCNLAGPWNAVLAR